MKERFLSFLFILFLAPGLCKAQALVRHATWSARAGTNINVPLIAQYYDFSVVKGADYFWEYRVKPKAGMGFYGELSSVRPLRSRKHPGFISYAFGYRQLVRKMAYNGWEGGGISGVYNMGEGAKQWNDHYLTFSGSITHQFFLGLKRKIILNSLGISAGFRLYEQEIRDFSGSSTYTDGTVVMNSLGYDRKGVNSEFYIPQLLLTYEIGYVIPAGKSVFIPHFFVPILNLNNYLQKYEPHSSPLRVRKEYYKELMVGLTFMRASMK